MQKNDWMLADIVARDLVNRETDINELQKVVTFTRVQMNKPDSKVGERFFTLLDTMVRDGRYLVRSGRTIDYYRDLQAVSREHLSHFRTASGDDGKKLVEVLGWTVRLMRYYITEAGDAELVARQRGGAYNADVPKGQPAKADVPAQQKTITFEELLNNQAPSRTQQKLEIKKEIVTLVTATKNGKAQIRTAQGEECNCSSFPAFPAGKVGETCRAELTRENGKITKCVFKAWS